jgi:lysophospholipid acyltransferase (LPLAT)-like uncharacterized protein
MKNLQNLVWLQDLLAGFIVAYLKFCYATTRFTQHNQAKVEAIWASKVPVVLMMWHERLHLGHACWPKGKGQPVCVLASNSKSGEISMKVNSRFGYHSIRGSSAKKSDPSKQKGGASAFRNLLRWLGKGGCVSMTPDGPRGPRREMTQGTLKLSQMSGGSMILVGLSTSRFITLDTWDKMRLPLPFAKGAMVWEVMAPVPDTIDEAGLLALCEDVGRRLSLITDQADGLIGRVTET